MATVQRLEVFNSVEHLFTATRDRNGVVRFFQVHPDMQSAVDRWMDKDQGFIHLRERIRIIHYDFLPLLMVNLMPQFMRNTYRFEVCDEKDDHVGLDQEYIPGRGPRRQKAPPRVGE